MDVHGLFNNRGAKDLRGRIMGNDAPIDAQQVRSIVTQTRTRGDELAAAGVNSARLEAKLSEIEKCVDEKHHDQNKLRSLLTELEADLIEVESKLVTSGILPELHQILGTGVPAPR
jgi:hypothetical protein